MRTFPVKLLLPLVLWGGFGALSALAEEGAAAVPGLGDMDALYAEVEVERRLLDRELRTLRGRLRGLKLKHGEAREVVRAIRRARHLLKEPRLRAAFSDREELREELAAVERARRHLQQAVELTRAR